MKPSLIDIQVNGFAGVDFQQPDLSRSELGQAVDGLAAHETRRFFLTLITDGVDALCEKLANCERHRLGDVTIHEAVCGYHIEGPWLSPLPGFCGAHDPAWMGPPNWPDFEKLQKAADGHIKLITLAPEWPGSADVIRRIVDSGVEVSLGHTDASDADITAAIAAGARFCTHLGNGVPTEMHRHDNVIQRLLARDELTAFFIPDGIHLPPASLKNFFRAKPPGKALFTTDCMSAAGAPPGTYRIGRFSVEVGTDGVVREPGKTTFAGSSLSPNQGVKNAAAWLPITPAEARAAFSTEIAKAFRIPLPHLDG